MTAGTPTTDPANAKASPAPDRRRIWRDIARLLWEVMRAQIGAALGMLGLLLVGNTRTGIYLIATAGLVDALISGSSGGHSAVVWVAVYVGASALEQFYWAAKAVLLEFLRDQGLYRMQSRVLRRAATTPLIGFETADFFERLQRATNGMGDRLLELIALLIDFGQLVFMLLAVAAALYMVHPALLPILLAGTIPAVWLHTRAANVVYEAQRRHTTGDRIRSHLDTLLSGRDAAGETRLFGTANYLLGLWRELRLERGRDMLSAEKRRTLFNTLGGLCSILGYLAGLVLILWLILGGALSLGSYVAVVMGALWFQDMLSSLIRLIPQLEEQSQFIGDLIDFTQGMRADEWAGAGWPTPAAPAALTAGVVPRGTGMSVEARGVTFAYPGQSGHVLHSINLVIRPGEHIAIVGENGAGKSTLGKLLVGLYEPDDGLIILDGEPLGPGTAMQKGERIAAVFQDYATFQLTVRENIGFGNLNALDDDHSILEAARRADIHDLVTNLSAGVDTYLGRQFGETELSGGQWQRIALARAFMRDADLLILDEPTAALDPLAELALFEQFMELVRGRTAIMISHRLGAARLADRIVVLENGVIVELGSHMELMAMGGQYARMFSVQAQWYQ